MKQKKIIYAAGIGVLLFFLGAMAVEVTEQLYIQPNTISSWGELANHYYAARNGIPPIPSPVSYKTVVGMMAAEDWSFLSGFWSFNHSGGTLYLSEDSKLAKKLKLPMQIMVYEDLMRGEVVILGSADGKTYKGMALFTAPEWMPYEARFPLGRYLMDEIGPRRVVWSVTLKSEKDAWDDLLSSQEQAVSAAEPMMMTMSMPETITDFRIIQDGTNLSVNLPAEFVGATVSLKQSTNLIEGVWSTVLQTNATSPGVVFLGTADIPDTVYETTISTNWVNCPNHDPMDPGAVCTNQTQVITTNQVSIGGGVVYYRTLSRSTVDSDSDGLDNVTEYGLGTDYQDADSDDDLMPDGYEVSQNLDPLSAADGGYDSDGDGLVNSNEYANRTDPFNNDTNAPSVQVTGADTFYLP